ncbi:unnamed protein product [Symbiodinium microadriaticum]|nr:unnamed protein product [Symbiodinium microadriaticum]
MAPRKAGKKVTSPKYRKFWDGSRPQVWLVAPTQATASRSQSQGLAGRRQLLPSPFPPAPAQVGEPVVPPSLPPEESAAGEPIEASANAGALWSEDGSSRSRPSRRHSHFQEPGSNLDLVSSRAKSDQPSRVAGSERLSPPTPKGTVLPPWSAERANRDRPPWEIHAQKQLAYRQILDGQSADQASQRRRRREEVLELEKKSIPSLATKTHVWEQKDTESNPAAIMKEQLATAAIKKGQEHERKKQEEEHSRAWLQQAAVERAERYVAARQRQREEVSVLTHEWSKVAEEKKRQKEELKRAELREEKEALQRLVQGWVPPRRLRKPCYPPHNEEFHGAKTAR